MILQDRREHTGIRAALTMGLLGAIRKWGRQGRITERTLSLLVGFWLYYLKADMGEEEEGRVLVICDTAHSREPSDTNQKKRGNDKEYIKILIQGNHSNKMQTFLNTSYIDICTHTHKRAQTHTRIHKKDNGYTVEIIQP